MTLPFPIRPDATATPPAAVPHPALRTLRALTDMQRAMQPTSAFGRFYDELTQGYGRFDPDHTTAGLLSQLSGVQPSLAGLDDAAQRLRERAPQRAVAPAAAAVLPWIPPTHFLGPLAAVVGATGRVAEGAELADHAAQAAAAKAAAHAPIPELQDVAQRYVADNGISGARLPRVTKVDPAKAQLMARYYDAMPSEPHNPVVVAAHEQFVNEVHQQAAALRAAGYSWTPTTGDPYKNSAEMLADLRNNKHIYTFAATPDQAHPLVSLDDQNTFRAVHDILGHGQFGNQFGPIGEENAYRDHAAMFSPDARRVMGGLTRGQNSWVNFGPHSDLPVTERPYAQQKVALWPDELHGDYKDMTAPAMPAQAPFKAYSPLMTAIENGPKGTAAQWLAHLQKSGVSKMELDATGTGDLLRGIAEKNPTASLAPDSFRNHAEENALHLGGVTLPTPLSPADQARLDAAKQELRAREDAFNELRRVDADSYQALRGAHMRGLVPHSVGRMLEDGYDLGQIDPEHALHVITMRANADNFDTARRAANLARENYYTVAAETAGQKPGTRFGGYTVPGAKDNYTEQITTYKRPGTPDVRRLGNGEWSIDGEPATREQAQTAQDNTPTFRAESHWPGVDNPIAHLRFTTRTLPNGERVLFVEELQSDWHEQGRKKGYQGGADAVQAQKLADARDAAYQEYSDAYSSGSDAEADYERARAHYNNMTDQFPADHPDVQEAHYWLRDAERSHAPSRDRLDAARRAYHDASAQYENFIKPVGAVPDAPYKRTPEWTELNLKRALEEAARGGHDRIVFANGDQSAEHYALAKQVDRLEYHPESGTLSAYKNGSLLHQGKYDARALPDVLGKDGATALLNTEPVKMGAGDSGRHILEGDGLKVGGEGMRGYYDNMMPKMVRDYLKKIGHKDIPLETVSLAPHQYSVRPNPDGTFAVHLPNGDKLTSFDARADAEAGAARHNAANPDMYAGTRQLSFRMTPELRARILTKGQPIGQVDPALLRAIAGSGIGATAGAAAGSRPGDHGEHAIVGGALGGLAGGLLAAPEIGSAARGAYDNMTSGFREVTPEAFNAALDGLKKAKPDQAPFITYRTPEQMRAEGMRQFLSHDGKAGFALHPASGDMRNLFNYGDTKGMGARGLATQLTRGGRKLDAFDTKLTQIYRDMGFQETKRYPFDPQYAPDGWNYDKYGTPDVVEMEHPHAGQRRRNAYLASYKLSKALRETLGGVR